MEVKKGVYIRCNNCGKFGNTQTLSGGNEREGFYPVYVCPHCCSENIAVVIKKQKNK